MNITNTTRIIRYDYTVSFDEDQNEVEQAAFRRELGGQLGECAFASVSAVDVLTEKGVKNASVVATNDPGISALVGLHRDGVDTAQLESVLQHQLRQVRKAVSLGIPVASGSDAGAVGVFHGKGLLRELELLESAGVDRARIQWANGLLRERFSGTESVS